MAETKVLSCRCGKVGIELVGKPILAAECHCNSCRAAGARLGALPGAMPVQADNGGTPFVLYRKDRVNFIKGARRMAEFRLNPESPTRRVVARCCNTLLFLEFRHGHWLSLYAALWPEAARPAMEMRTMVADREDAETLDASIPSARHQSPLFFGRLLWAWASMRFRTPKIEVMGRIEG